jgi:hypothetical protein
MRGLGWGNDVDARQNAVCAHANDLAAFLLIARCSMGGWLCFRCGNVISSPAFSLRQLQGRQKVSAHVSECSLQ